MSYTLHCTKKLMDRIKPTCRIPDDCIDEKRYPLFMARAVMRELIESLQSRPGESPC